MLWKRRVLRADNERLLAENLALRLRVQELEMAQRDAAAKKYGPPVRLNQQQLELRRRVVDDIQRALRDVSIRVRRDDDGDTPLAGVG